jgi:hypothetical protein
LRITTRSSMSCPPISICRTLLLRSSSVPLPSKMILTDARVLQRGCPPAGIRSNLRITTHSSMSCPPVSICRTLLLRSSSVPLLSKTISTDAQVLQRGLLFLFVHWFNESCYVEGGGNR